MSEWSAYLKEEPCDDEEIVNFFFFFMINIYMVIYCDQHIYQYIDNYVNKHLMTWWWIDHHIHVFLMNVWKYGSDYDLKCFLLGNISK